MFDCKGSDEADCNSREAIRLDDDLQILDGFPIIGRNWLWGTPWGTPLPLSSNSLESMG
jgi:hypothetical protein